MKIVIERDPEKCNDILIAVLRRKIASIAVDCFSGSSQDPDDFHFGPEEIEIEVKDAPGADNVRSFDLEILVVFGATAQDVACSKTAKQAMQERFRNMVRRMIPEYINFVPWFHYLNASPEEA